jgi:hypothetical protein
MNRVRARKLEETTYETREGRLTVAVVLTEDGRVGIYEWDEEHGYFPLVALHTPEPWEKMPEPPPFHRRPSRSISPGRRDWDEWRRLDYSEFAKRVNAHEARTRELPIPAQTPRPQRARGRRSAAIRCPFCKARHNEVTQVVCEHLVAEGDREAMMVYHWPILDELMQLAEKAYDLDIEVEDLGSGVRGWEEAMKDDIRDLLTGSFLTEDMPGFQSVSRTVQSAMSESVYFWTFLSPKAKADVEGEFTELRSRFRRAITAA